jgi:hypothetical protein
VGGGGGGGGWMGKPQEVFALAWESIGSSQYGFDITWEYKLADFRSKLGKEYYHFPRSVRPQAPTPPSSHAPKLPRPHAPTLPPPPAAI